MLGQRYFRIIEDRVEVVRIVKLQNQDEVILEDQDNHKIHYSFKQLQEDYTLLNPDGFLSFNIVDTAGVKDVVITLHKRDALLGNNDLPYLICRQNINDLFANQLKINKRNYYGLCITQDTCPEDVPFESILSCDTLEKAIVVAVYIDDKFNDIIRIVKTRDFDFTLEGLFKDHVKHMTGGNLNGLIAKKLLNDKYVEGYCKTVKDLLEQNNFMYDFYRAFDIIPLNIVVSEETDQPIIENLSYLLCKNIINIFVVKYGKDIDLNAIDGDYQLITDNNGDIYVVAYIASGEYNVPVECIESADNINIINTLASNKVNKVKEAYKNLNFNTDKYK